MSESTPQPDFFLHLDLTESRTQPDGDSFIDFTEPQSVSLESVETEHNINHDGATHSTSGDDSANTIPWTNESKAGITESSLEQDSAQAHQAFAGLLASQPPGTIHWDTANNPQVYGSLMDMELHKSPPAADATGYITPNLIFPSTSAKSVVGTVENADNAKVATNPLPNMTKSQQGATTTIAASSTTPESSITETTATPTASTARAGKAVPALIQTKPMPAATVKDTRRSQRTRRQSSMAAQSEEYVQNSLANPLPSPATIERVTRSKKVYCHCQKPDDGNVMIQCDHCRQWFHGACVDITEEIATIMDLKNEKYFCDPCLEILKEKSKGSGGAGKAFAISLSDARNCALPVCLNEARDTNDYCSEECAIKGIELEASQAVSSAGDTFFPTAVVSPTQSSVPRKVATQTKVASPASPKPGQDPIRSTALKGFTDSLMVAFDRESENKEDELESATKLAMAIEKELYLFSATPGMTGCGKDYKPKYRSLFFNLKDKNNVGLRTRVLSGDLTPHALVRLTPDELANPELQTIAEEVRKKSIHDSVLTVELEPFIKKTHKGDVTYFPGLSGASDPLAVTANDASKKTGDSDEEHKSMDSAAQEEENNDITKIRTPPNKTPIGSPTTDALDKLLARIQTNKRSGDDILIDALSSEKRSKLTDLDWDRNGNDSGNGSYLPREPSPYSPSPSPHPSPVLGSTSPKDSPPPFMLEEIQREVDRKLASERARQPLPVWQGTLAMQQVAKLSARMVQVGGKTIPGKLSRELTEMTAPGWTDILTKSIVIDGRIPVETVDKYVSQQAQSPTKEIVIVQFHVDGRPDSDAWIRGQDEFKKLFRYFHEKKRNGVIPNKGRRVKDIYLVPVGAKDTFPPYFKSIVANESRLRSAISEHSLFGVIILNKASASHTRHHGHHSPSQSRSSASHHNHHQRQQSPRDAVQPYPSQQRHESRERRSHQPTTTVTVSAPAGTTAQSPVSQTQPAQTTPAQPQAPTPAPIRAAPSLQELQGLVNQLFPSKPPTQPQPQPHLQSQSPAPAAVSTPTPAAAAVTAQLTSSTASLIAGLPAHLTRDLSQTMAQFQQRQQQQQQQEQQPTSQAPAQQQQTQPHPFQFSFFTTGIPPGTGAQPPRHPPQAPPGMPPFPPGFPMIPPGFLPSHFSQTPPLASSSSTPSSTSQQHGVPSTGQPPPVPPMVPPHLLAQFQSGHFQPPLPPMPMPPVPPHLLPQYQQQQQHGGYNPYAAGQGQGQGHGQAPRGHEQGNEQRGGVRSKKRVWS
ncbi:PHD finger protein 3 [Podila humilis]|nr:PHD finger protein 3 [Podila humilis]